MITYFFYFTFTFVVSVVATFLVATIMRKLEIVDKAGKEKRKIHKKSIALGGGLSIFFSFFLSVLIAWIFADNFTYEIFGRNLFGLFLGSFVLVLGGLLDDKYVLRPKLQILFPFLATIIIIFSGIGPHVISNPFGGYLPLDFWKISFGSLGTFVVVADLLVFFWLMGMMFTTKFLDGLDGLVSGVVSIGAVVLFFFSLQRQWYQPDVAMLAIILAGATLGFLVWNWFPAKIFLGEGGSLLTGFLLGTLAIISGGKIAITLLIMAVPILDVARVIVIRIKNKKPIYVGDNEHLHFRLLASGLSQKQAVLLLYALSLAFGLTALFLQSSQKFWALLLLFVIMVLLGLWFSKKRGTRN
ncbi:MAG: MraY family glycosyltransferase [Patescibacteria group bacterium]|nr:MraY family glycosyltransferase [Patescibacteria group bacterium]